MKGGLFEMISVGEDGPKERLAGMFVRHYAPLVSLLRREFRKLSLDDARDVAQEAFVRVLKRMDAPILNEWALLCVTATRLAINVVTRDHLAASADIDAFPPLADPGPNAQAQLESRERQKLIAGAILELPPATRSCVLLRLEGHSYREIAILLKIKLDAVKSRLHYAKTRLRERLGSAMGEIDFTKDDRDDS